MYEFELDLLNSLGEKAVGVKCDLKTYETVNDSAAHPCNCSDSP